MSDSSAAPSPSSPPSASGPTSGGATTGDGSSAEPPPSGDDVALLGVLLVGHGDTASHLLAAARRIVTDGLDGVEALDAWDGRTPELDARICDRIGSRDHGRGVLILVDLMGSSPCSCALAQASGHDVVVVAGLNIAMLLKLATVDRRQLDVHAIAEACAESGRRAVVVREAKVA